MSDAEETTEKISLPKLPAWLQPGVRKIVILGVPMAFVFLAATVFVFVGKMEPPEWGVFCLDVLRWGGGIFAVGNVLEHLSDVPAKVISAKP